MGAAFGGLTGYVHSIEAGGMVDGPGIRYVVFLSGCPLRCRYCHNPDTWRPKAGRPYSVDGILAEVRKYKSYMRFSGGGITVTGGEPLMQPDFLAGLLAACRAEGIHTTLDTSGYDPAGAAAKALPHTNLLLLDIKSINPETYMKVTGVPIDKTLDTLRLSQSLKVPVWVRFVLVPGLTDDIGDIRKMAAFLKDFDNIEKVEVLPFHKLGEYKWGTLGTPYTLADTQPPSAELLKRVKGILES